MSKNVKIAIGLIALALVILAVAKNQKTKKPGETKTENDSYKIGLMGPFTGDAAVYGEPLKKTIGLAVEEINTNGGIGGKKIEIIAEDAKCNGKDGTSAAQKLINVDKVKVILGGFCSSESLAAVPVAEQNKVLLLSAGSSSPKLTGISKFFFRNYPSDASQGKVLAEIAIKKGWKNTAFIQEQTDYALGVYQAFSKRYEELSGKITKEEFASNVNDFKSQLIKLKAANADVLFVDTQTPAAAERIFKQLKDLGWKPTIMVSDATSGDPKTVEANKDILENAFAAEFGTDPSNLKFKNLLQAYKTKFGSEVPYQSYAQTEYDAVYVLRDGIAAVGYDGEKLADWSRTIKDWEGASGKTTIGSDGDRLGGHIVKIIRNGKVEIYTE